ncbi:MAG: hypothetical protein ACXWI3_05210 [Croceibacterium sp.]
MQQKDELSATRGDILHHHAGYLFGGALEKRLEKPVNALVQRGEAPRKLTECGKMGIENALPLYEMLDVFPRHAE